MGTKMICCAPCSWGVDFPDNPNLPPWKRVLREAGRAGYRAIELGPYGYLPLDVAEVTQEMNQNGLAMVAGTIFEDLVDVSHRDYLMEETDNICSLITKLPALPLLDGQKVAAPYLVVIDWGHDERDYAAGHPDRAPRLPQEDWDNMMETIRMICARAERYGVRVVIHPHAGGYIEYADEIRKAAQDIPYETAGLCLDTGHLYYSRMDPVEFLREFADRIDYIHFKDIDKAVYEKVLGMHIRFFEGCGIGSMCPIGRGCLDYPAIRDCLDEIGYGGYITIEQERDPRNVDGSLEDVKSSVDYLKRVGYLI